MELNETNLVELANWFFDENAPTPSGISSSRVDVASECFNQLFLKEPESLLDASATESFERMIQDQFQASPAKVIAYDSPYPKYEFLRYLTKRGYLLHGTKTPEINMLEPREQIDWNGTPLWAVFATRDPFWPMYFALLNREMLSGSIRNGCFLVERSFSEKERFYFFSVNQENLRSNIWSDGFIYVLRGDSFRRTTGGQIRFDEWASEQPVAVMTKLQISPEDFPFLHQVTGHDENESIFKTWLQYKDRLQAPSSRMIK